MQFTNSNYYRVTDENHSYYGRVGRLVKEAKYVFSGVILKLDFGTTIEVTESFAPDQLGEAFQLYELVYYEGNPYRIIQIDTYDAGLPYKIAEDYSESSLHLWVSHNSLKHNPRDLTQEEYNQFKNQFPVGTKVRITKEGTHSYGVGDIAKISDIKNYSKNMNQMFNTTYENGSFNECGWLYPDEFEPVEEKEEPCEEKCEDVSASDTYEVWAELHNGSKTCLVTDLISKEHALHRMSDVCHHITNELMFHVEHTNEFINTKYIMRVYIHRERCGTAGEELAEAVSKLVRNIHGTII